jgi:uncharacterized alkaline shock family protein YloU
MNMLFRVLLAVYAFCLAVLSAVFMLITFEHSILDSIYNYLSGTVLGNGWSTVLMLVISLVFFVLSITFLLSGFRIGKEKKAVSKNTDIGQIMISLDTIKSIALSASRMLQGITGARAAVSKMENDVAITIRMNVLPDTSIPALSEEMQLAVKKAVEGSSGITVRNVQVIVEDISEPEGNKPAVSSKP